jgi:hypothetical protein
MATRRLEQPLLSAPNTMFLGNIESSGFSINLAL